MLTPDIIVNVKFYATEENGRKLPTGSDFFGCIFTIGDKKHDCRLFLNDIGAIAPGESKKSIPIKFLCPELVIPNLKIGSRFYLWDMRNIAEGEVQEIIYNKK